MVQYEISVTGKVQGVGYRYFVQKQAKALNLNGWVRNTIDSGVLACVQGNKTAIQTFIDFLWIGPPLSEVRSVNQVETQIFEDFTDFEIRV